MNEKQVEEAIGHYRQALAIKPDLVEAHYNLGLALLGQGKTAEAIDHFRQAFDCAVAQNQAAAAETIQAKLKAVVGGN
jgi:tetratricopeptide (TPR) repeat protein